jgi:hypothetical protein
MKEVRIFQGLAGRDYTFPAGSLQTVTDEKAAELQRKGLAEIVGTAKTTVSRKAAERRTATIATPKPEAPKAADTEQKAEPQKAEPKPERKKRGRKPRK